MIPADAAAAPSLASDAAPDDDLVVLLPSLELRVLGFRVYIVSLDDTSTEASKSVLTLCTVEKMS